MVSPDQILSRLPTFQGKWELIKRKQYVPDIIKEILAAHVEFEQYYDCFSYLFYDDDVYQVAETLHGFCKRYIQYRAENVAEQTTALPTGIIARGTGDCKHYALFIAGVIASLDRLYGCGFDWWYCFAGYDGATEPYHVFVAVAGVDEDIWIDPTPGSGGIPSVLKEYYV